MIIILSFRVGISKNKNTDHRVNPLQPCVAFLYPLKKYIRRNINCKKTEKFVCEISIIINPLQPCVAFLYTLKKYIRRTINCKKTEKFVCEISIIIILIC